MPKRGIFLLILCPSGRSLFQLSERVGRIFAEGHRYAADVLWSEATPATLLGALRDGLAEAPSPKSFGMLGLASAPPPDAPPLPAMALDLFAPAFAGLYGLWDDPAADAANEAWFRAQQARLQPLVTGHYVGESDLLAAPDRARRSFTDEGWRRLSALARRHDPDGRFASFPTS